MSTFADKMKKTGTESSYEEELKPVKASYKLQKGVLNMLWFTCDGIGLPIVEKLVKEGNNVVVGMVQCREDMGQDCNEDEQTKRRRLSLFDGIIAKEDAMKVIEKMEGIEEKDEWIVFFDFNDMGPLAERALEMGFTKGLFPTEEDTEYEQDRDMAKDVVIEHYPDLSVAEKHNFKHIEEAVEFLAETDRVWVLKGNADGAKTIVPAHDDVYLGRKVLMDALDAQKKEYEKGGFILEEKIVNGLELTPQIVFLDGKVVFTDIDIENKNIGAGNIGIQTGAMQSLIMRTELSDRINKIAFPKWVYDQAKKHVGLYITDAGLICKDGKYYFTEFCFQRFGFDAIFAEIDMAGSATDYFKKIFSGENPLQQQFGIAVRGMNFHKDDEERRVLEGVSMSTTESDHTFIFECKEEDGVRVSTGTGWDLAAFTGSSDNVNEAVEKAYKHAGHFGFEDMHIRPEFDLMSYDYGTSIPNRYAGLNHRLFEGPEMKGHDRYLSEKKVNDLRERLDEALEHEGQE